MSPEQVFLYSTAASWVEALTVPAAFPVNTFKAVIEMKVSSRAKFLWLWIALHLLAAFNAKHVQTLARGVHPVRPGSELNFNC